MAFLGECKECHKTRYLGDEKKMDDLDFYKAALARWSARNNFLIDKWTKVLNDVKDDLQELHACTPSLERDWRIRAKELVMIDIQIFLDDLKAPAFSDLDFKADKDSFKIQSGKRVDATQIDLLDGDYVRQSF